MTVRPEPPPLLTMTPELWAFIASGLLAGRTPFDPGEVNALLTEIEAQAKQVAKGTGVQRGFVSNDTSSLLSKRAQWYRDGCPDLEDDAGYAQNADNALANDAASDLETALRLVTQLRADVARLTEENTKLQTANEDLAFKLDQATSDGDAYESMSKKAFADREVVQVKRDALRQGIAQFRTWLTAEMGEASVSAARHERDDAHDAFDIAESRSSALGEAIRQLDKLP